MPYTMYRYFLKRILDFIIALCALAILCPVLLIIALCLCVANKRAGVFFVQDRPGIQNHDR
jgi:lipopolysaccharide/colanic/teichoic acid biosynthesis glycosyltransferase